MASFRALLRAPSRHFFASPVGQTPGMEALLVDENGSADGDNVSVSKSAVMRSPRKPLAPSPENTFRPTSPKEGAENGCKASIPQSIPPRLSTPPKSPSKASRGNKATSHSEREGLNVYEEQPSTPTAEDHSTHTSPQKGPTPTWAKKAKASASEELARESPEHSERRSKSPWGRRAGTARALVLEDSPATAVIGTPRTPAGPRTLGRTPRQDGSYPRLGLGPGHSKHDGHSYMASPALQALAESLQEEESEGAIEDQSVQVRRRERLRVNFACEIWKAQSEKLLTQQEHRVGA